MAETLYKVSEVARLANVTVRALHHYDEIGLLRPSGRSGAGYRLYSEADLVRLHRIAVGRSLGLALEEIRRALDDPNTDARGLLAEHRATLVDRLHDTHAKIRAIDAALRRLDPQPGDETMDPKDMFEGFDPTDYEHEARARWGETDAYAESARRTKRYTPDDWSRLKAEANEILTALANAKSDGVLAADAVAMGLAERYRLHIDQWFYPCSHETHAGLAKLYAADARFAANFEKYGEGMANYVGAAVVANANRLQGRD